MAPDPFGRSALERFDPVLRARLPQLLAASTSADGLTPEESQQALIEFSAPLEGPPPPDVQVQDTLAPGPHGDIPVRVYRPRAGTAPGRGLVWMHGGGFVFGDLDMPEADVASRELCQRASAVVVSVDYRLASQDVHYPIPHDDVHAAWTWATGPQGPLAGAGPWSIGGASAGANLALGAAQRIRDERAGGADVVRPESIILAYPKAHAVTPEGDDDWRDCVAVLPPALVFEPSVIAVFDRAWYGDRSQPLTYADPGDGDLGELPATLVIVSEFDTLRPSGEALARDLGAAGSPVTLLTAKGAPHGHLNIVNLPVTIATLDDMARFLSRPATARQG